MRATTQPQQTAWKGCGVTVVDTDPTSVGSATPELSDLRNRVHTPGARESGCSTTMLDQYASHERRTDHIDSIS
jgi:hypothetical protein